MRQHHFSTKHGLCRTGKMGTSTTVWQDGRYLLFNAAMDKELHELTMGLQMDTRIVNWSTDGLAAAPVAKVNFAHVQRSCVVRPGTYKRVAAHPAHCTTRPAQCMPCWLRWDIRRCKQNSETVAGCVDGAARRLLPALWPPPSLTDCLAWRSHAVA